MKSQTAFFKSSLIFSDIKRFSWAAVLQTIILYLVCVMPIMTWNHQFNYNSAYSFRGYASLANFTMCIYAVAIAALVFSYLHNAAGSTMLHGMPFSRTTLFISNSFAGWILLLVPSLLNTLALLIVKYTMHVGQLLRMEWIFSWLWSNISLGLVMYALAIFVGMLTGNIAAHVVFTYIIHILPAAIYLMLNAILSIVLYGYQLPSLPSVLANFPLYQFGEITGRFAWIYLLATAVLLVLALVFYRMRPLECAGDVIVFDWIKPIFKYGVALCTAMAGYLYVTAINGSSVHPLLSLLFALLGYAIAEMLLRRTWNIVHAWKGYLACVGIILAFALCCKFDVLGIVQRVPEPQAVSSVKVSGLLRDAEVSYTDAHDLERVCAWHTEICTSQPSSTNDSVTLWLSYQMKNGGTLNRQYTIPQTLTLPLLELTATKEQSSILLTLPIRDMQTLAIYDANHEMVYVIGSFRELQAFKDAYRQDIQSMQGSEFLAGATLDYYAELQYHPDNGNDSYYRYIPLYAQCTATRQLIESLLQ